MSDVEKKILTIDTLKKPAFIAFGGITGAASGAISAVLLHQNPWFGGVLGSILGASVGYYTSAEDQKNAKD